MILVTGATGFIGRVLTAELARRNIPFKAVSRHAVPEMVQVERMDGTTDWSAALEGVDAVVHLAARVHVMREAASDPLEAFRAVNVEMTANLARQAADRGVRRFIFVSSIKVNGSSTMPGKPFTADDQPGPDDDYGRSKAEAEAELSEIASRTGMEIVVIRPPLVYGPGVGANFDALMRWARSGLPSVLAGIRNRRSLVYVGNLCDLIIRTLSHPAAANQIFLVSDGVDVSTHQLLQELARLQGRRAFGITVPAFVLSGLARLAGREAIAERLIGNLQVDIAKTRRLLDWEPPVSQSEGLRLTVEGVDPRL